MRKVQVTFTDEQWEIISKLRGMMGSSDSEIVRTIVLAWLAEKSIIASTIKEAGGGSQR
ncbi:MAG: CopG family transcriptional regulator [Candidatus Njordarchaeales archaeon]